jgi:hypothetical protein
MMRIVPIDQSGFDARLIDLSYAKDKNIQKHQEITQVFIDKYVTADEYES